MIIISKREKEIIAARPKREELIYIPSAGAEHKTRKMRGGSRKPSKLVIYIYIYIVNINIYICLYIEKGP